MLTQGKKGLITITELKSLGFQLNYGRTITDSNKIVTKEEAITNYNLAPTPLQNYILNQLPPEEAFQTGPDCTGCTSYDITITQADIDLSDDNKVYVYHYACGNYSAETLNYMSFAYSGTYKSYICVQNCANVLPFVGYLYDSNVPTIAQYGSNILPLSGNCGTIYPSCTTGGTFTYTVNNSGYNYCNIKVELSGQTYGNVGLIISATTVNSENEIFVGNFDEKFGNVYTYGSGSFINPTGDTVGFHSGQQKTTLDVVVYSSHSGTTFTPYTINFDVKCPSGNTISCSAPATTGTTVSGTTLNVTKTGYIRYSTPFSNSVDVNITTLGTYTINDCIVTNSVRSAFPISSTYLANYNNVVYGSNCGVVTTGTVNVTFNCNDERGTIVYWVDGFGNEKLKSLTYNETFNVCGLYGSASGLNCTITYGSTCISIADPTPTDPYNLYYISSNSYSICDTACSTVATPTIQVWSYASAINELYNYPIFSDKLGTLFVGTGNYYRIIKSGGTGFGHSITVDEYGIVGTIRACLNNSPGSCGGIM